MHPVFLLGAGFNREARACADRISARLPHHGEQPIKCGYPVVADLAQICFERPMTAGESIEEMFQAALESQNFAPTDRMAEALMKADYYIPRCLVEDRVSAPNPYAAFFKKFRASQFLTFNYDSLVEQFLFHDERWYPSDGYGVPVRVSKESLQAEPPDPPSTSLVLHLHGSLCVYSRETEIQRQPGSAMGWIVAIEPRYLFDPDSIGGRWRPYARHAGIGRVPVGERIIAPVPDKARGLRLPFVKAVYRQALDLLSRCEQVVSIGYSFNQNDELSYQPLLEALAANPRSQLVVVSPDAELIARRLSGRHQPLNSAPIPLTFGQWAASGFKS